MNGRGLKSAKQNYVCVPVALHRAPYTEEDSGKVHPRDVQSESKIKRELGESGECRFRPELCSFI